MSFLDVAGRAWEDLTNDVNVIHMGHNCNLLPVDASINQTMIEAIAGDRYRNYPPPYGLDELRGLIRSDIGAPHADVLITNGATEAIYQALSVILRPDDELMVTDPAWPHIRNFAISLRAKVVEVPVYSGEAKFKLLPDLIRAHLSDRTRVIAVIDPLNPLGSSYSEQEIRAICEIAAEREIYVLHDSTYRHFAGAHHYPAVRCYERAIVAVSLSKVCGFAGLRMGAVIVAPELFQQLVVHHISRLGVNKVVQLGAIAAYRTQQNWLPRMLAVNADHQRKLNDCFETIPGLKTVALPSMGNFLAADVTGTGCDAEEVVRRTLSAGFVIRSGVYTSQRFGNSFIRVTTTVPTEHIEKFCQAFPVAIADRVPA